MRKIILLIMLIFFVITPAFAMSKSKSSDVAVIKDELLEHPKFAHKNSIKNEYIPIEDELLNYKPKSNSVFSLEVLKEDEFQDVVIKDELMSDDFLKQAIDTKIEKTDTPNDYFIEKIVDVNKVRKIQPKTVYDFSKKAVLINIKLPDNFQKKNFVLEGKEVPFESTHDFVINGKKFSKGTEIIGRIETFSASDKMGIPESIKISNFYKIKVLTQYKSDSLNKHIVRGWPLSPIVNQYVDLVPAQMRTGGSWYKGTADAIYQNVDWIDGINPKIPASTFLG